MWNYQVPFLQLYSNKFSVINFQPRRSRMGYNAAIKKMKKMILGFLLIFSSLFMYAIPSGTYYTNCGSRDYMQVLISGSDFYYLNRDGKVIATWHIVKEEGGVVTLKSDYGTYDKVSWWREDGNVYMNCKLCQCTLILK